LKKVLAIFSKMMYLIYVKGSSLIIIVFIMQEQWRSSFFWNAYFYLTGINPLVFAI